MPKGTGQTGDLDFTMWTIAGSIVGGSYGIGDWEYFNAGSRAEQVMFLQVVGFNGKTNYYWVDFECWG